MQELKNEQGRRDHEKKLVLQSTHWRCSEEVLKFSCSVFSDYCLNYSNLHLPWSHRFKKNTAAKYYFITLCPDLPACLCLGALQRGLAVEAVSHLACSIRTATGQIWTLKIDGVTQGTFLDFYIPFSANADVMRRQKRLGFLSAEVFDGLSWASCSSSLSLVPVLMQLDRVVLQGATVARSQWLPFAGLLDWCISSLNGFLLSHLKARARKSGGGKECAAVEKTRWPFLSSALKATDWA